MKTKATESKRWFVLILFAIAMAWLESAVVFYLRTMVNRIEPHQPNPLPVVAGLESAEVVRELATLVMLGTVGWLAGRTARSRFGYFTVAFGVWDIFYYVFLKVLTGWPHSLHDWDVLFLIPLPWWGPVLAPMLIATLLILGGSLLVFFDEPGKPFWPGRLPLALSALGSFLALWVFMADTLRAAPHGIEAVREVLPVTFHWSLFLTALALMAFPVVELLLEVRNRTRPPNSPNLRKWKELFARNRQDRQEPQWSLQGNVPPEVLKPLLHSLEQFQLGDGGGPASLIAFDAERFRGSSDELRDVVDAWFAEEREHARLLGCAVDRFGGRRITSHWSFTAFCLCRRWLGVRFELQILTLTELVSTAYYRVLQRHSPDVPLEQMCALILRDEALHLAFHCDRLASAGRPRHGLSGAWWLGQFWLLGHAAASVLWISHSACLTALGSSLAEYFGEVRRELGRFIFALSSASARLTESDGASTSPAARTFQEPIPSPA